MNKKLKVGIGTDAFPPTTDGISNVAQNYAAEINKRLGEAVVITPKNPNQLDYKYNYIPDFYMHYGNIAPLIIHYAGKKPWKPITPA